MEYRDIISQVAKDLNLSTEIVDKTYKSYWRAIREHISAQPLKEDLTDEEFMHLQPNVNIPSIGKLHVTLDRYKRMKKMFNIVKEKKNVAHQED